MDRRDSGGEDIGEGAGLLGDYEKTEETRLSSESTIAEEPYQTEKRPEERRLVRALHKVTQNLKFSRFSPKIALLLLPSFIYPWSPQTTSKTPHPTAYLDGLRGLAAVFVVTSHYCALFAPAMLEGYGSGGPQANIDNNDWAFQLPLLRVISSGQFMVVLFYVLSGCVLSARGLKLARSGKQSQFASTMASSVFRRWIRLHLPVIASMFIAFLISRGEGWARLQPDWLKPTEKLSSRSMMNLLNANHIESTTLKVRQTAQPVRYVWVHDMAVKLPSLSAQIWHWLSALPDVCDPFRFGIIKPGASVGYNAGGVLWTIPAEWLGSMVVFLVILGLAWTSVRVRFVIIFLITLWCHLSGRWEIASFLSGTLIADLMLNHASRMAKSVELPTDERRNSVYLPKYLPKTPSKFVAKALDIFWITLFITGIYLGTQPYAFPATSLGYSTLWSWIPAWYQPADRFYLCLGSVFSILALTHCTVLQRTFATPFMRYLGRISFSLYLLHTQILISLGIRVMSWCMKVVDGGHSDLQYGVGFTMGAVVMAPITIWASDLFCRAVDEQSVEFARWLAEKLLHMDE